MIRRFNALAARTIAVILAGRGGPRMDIDRATAARSGGVSDRQVSGDNVVVTGASPLNSAPSEIVGASPVFAAFAYV